MHGSRIKAVATDSCMANAMPCSVDRRWYCRSRAICGSTREPDDDGAPPLPPRTASWCLSICLRHLAHRSIVDGGSSSPPVTAGFVKNAARPTCFVVSAVRRHAKQSTSTLPSVASRAWRRRFLESFVLMAEPLDFQDLFLASYYQRFRLRVNSVRQIRNGEGGKGGGRKKAGRFVGH
jgi:hypothetical protein